MIQTEQAVQRLIARDPGLSPYAGDLRMHLDRCNARVKTMGGEAGLADFANAHSYFGFHRTESGWVFREWLPGADAVWLYGDFNAWKPYEYPLTRLENGVWELFLAGENAICHGQYVKLLVGKDGGCFERIPAYIRYTGMDEKTDRLCGRIWMPQEPFSWTDAAFYRQQRSEAPLIYEAHVGMAQERYGVGSFREFADLTLPWISQAGYNTVQLMAIQEHPYYASFGYQVTNFFAPSHRFGTPEDLKYLINRAHGMGIAVLLDVVHSHACPNEGEGLHAQDGTDTQYFLPGARGWHEAWKTRCFDYGKREVLQLLLSNLRYWQEEFHFDGFRFDGVTSMLYENHGLGVAFTHYRQYFSMNTNVDARVYLMLANALVHRIDPTAITVAEEMSGMPGMCLPLGEGGFGFDYRLSMGVPDLWIKLTKDVPPADWDVRHLWYELTSGRVGEKAIGYSESHDQAMVGDKTLIFRMADAEMYTGMGKDYHTPSMDAAIEMHKLIRFSTATLAKSGYLNFMGNEFGHPEWIDFPREGNGWSYHYARRQWSLVQNPAYKYEWLANFDRELIALLRRYDLYNAGEAECLWLDAEKHLMIFARGELLFAVNLHPTQSQESVFVNCARAGMGGYRVILSSDDAAFGGQDRISRDYVYRPQKGDFGFGFSCYLPCRTALVLAKCVP